VTALVVGAERVGSVAAFDKGRRLEAVEQVQAGEVERVVRGQPGREHGGDYDEEYDQRRYDRDRVVAEAIDKIAVQVAAECVHRALATTRRCMRSRGSTA